MPELYGNISDDRYSPTGSRSESTILPEAQLSALVGLLQTLVDPVTAALQRAPIDGEEETPAEQSAVQQARDWLAANGSKGVAHDEAMPRLSLN